MKFVGIDALPHEGVMYVKQGILDATFQYPTGGAEAIQNGLKIFAGEKVPPQDHAGVEGVHEGERGQGRGGSGVAAQNGQMAKWPNQSWDPGLRLSRCTRELLAAREWCRSDWPTALRFGHLAI